MGSQDSSFMLSSNTPFPNEGQWVAHMRSSVEKDEEEKAQIPVSVFTVPKPLHSAKPEAFTPQLFAFGPYHHWRPQLYEMERYKLEAAKRTQKKLYGVKLHHLVDQLQEHESVIRAHYHRFLDFTGETLAWLMAIDASFLLEFLHTYSDMEGKAFKQSRSMSQLVDPERMKLGYNLILRDALMLENQIPLFVLRKILQYQCSSLKVADDMLSKMLMGFVNEVSPFKFPTDNFSCVDIKEQAHLLQLLYSMIVPKPKSECLTIEIEEIKIGISESMDEEFIKNSSYVKQLFSSVWSHTKSINLEPLGQVKKLLITRPFKLVMKVPWKIISSLPLISAFKWPIESFFSMKKNEKSKDEDSTKGKPPLVEEIMVPSVSELTQAGVKFMATEGDVTAIAFDVKAATLYLPTVTLDVNTEVLLRNLVAYESSVESGPMVFTRYTELINGIIDTVDDVKLLRQSGVILNRMKSDDEVASLCNGMSRSVRLTKVGFIDKVLVDVNQYYNSRWSVKSKRMLKTYVLGSWQLLAFLAAILLLLMTCIQAFCSVYHCNAHWSGFTNPV